MRFLAFFVPCRENAYRPYVLRRRSLAVFLCVALAAEVGAIINPPIGSMVLLAAVVLLLALLALSFFLHIQVQSFDLMASGLVVVLIAASFLAFNAQVLGIGDNLLATLAHF